MTVCKGKNWTYRKHTLHVVYTHVYFLRRNRVLTILCLLHSAYLAYTTHTANRLPFYDLHISNHTTPIIAALSVQYTNFVGNRSCFVDTQRASVIFSRNLMFADTPHTTPIVGAEKSRTARISFVDSTSVTCSWNAYATAAFWSSLSTSMRPESICWWICPFIPEKLTLYGWPGSLAAWTDTPWLPVFAHGLCAISPIRLPPGYGHHSILATLSKHSPAASSIVWPSFFTKNEPTCIVSHTPIWCFLCSHDSSISSATICLSSCLSDTRYKSLWPPLTVKHTYGNCNVSRDLSINTENTWPMIWCTSTTGLSYTILSVYAAVTPTINAHGSHGCTVTEIQSICIRSTSSSSSTTSIFSAWALAAISGTTPHRCWCSLVCVYERIFSTWNSSQDRETTASDVSSQLVSIAKVFMIFKKANRSQKTATIIYVV
jgi:hypothetical protein